MGKGSPTITVRLPTDLMEICKKAVREGKAQNMTELVKKALVCYLQLNPQDFLVEL